LKLLGEVEEAEVLEAGVAPLERVDGAALALEFAGLVAETSLKRGHKGQDQQKENTYEEEAGDEADAALVVTVAPMENAPLVPITALILLCIYGVRVMHA
jgi:hypothetical protein